MSESAEIRRVQSELALMITSKPKVSKKTMKSELALTPYCRILQVRKGKRNMSESDETEQVQGAKQSQ
jgi:hypothetical protein